ncbi:hypothetical protein [uncultured Mucilaginibacter sp.]|uniref:hypothetical protein n=1 Tax=uncultured Mucilaginibacter sp. TaxID=797541 RepID=UPI002605929D|nr:hypothetical protein [uncultured Mucilaginibacter sp.]
MKKNIIYAVVATFMVGFLLSFSLINKNTVPKPPKLDLCNAGVTNLHIIRDSGGYITFGWDGVNSPDHYNYGGYYQGGGNFSGTAYSNTVTIQRNMGNTPGGRFGVTADCADGSTASTGASQNILYY